MFGEYKDLTIKDCFKKDSQLIVMVLIKNDSTNKLTANLRCL